MKSVFPYPGGKSYLAQWVVEQMPDHECYVEAFAGSAAVLVAKQPSNVEVINDRDGDIVQFFETLRDQPEELREWLRNTPYSYDLHRKFAHEFYKGYRPDCTVERAGRFYYLRYSQFAGKYTSYSGFSSVRKRNRARTVQKAVDELEEFADRLRDVQIENRDYEYILDRFDGEETLFYLDPPYVKEGDDLYSHDVFDHGRLASALSSLDGMWMVSYTDVPPKVEQEAAVVLEKNASQRMRAGQPDRQSERRTERLVCSFEPSETAKYIRDGHAQAKLTEVS